VLRQRFRHGIEFLLQLQRQLLLAQLAHQRGFRFDEDELTVVDHTDGVGELLGFLDVMRRQNDGDAGLAQLLDELPHVGAQHHVDACGRLIEKENLWLVRERFGDHHAALHAARELDDLAVFLVPQRQVFERLLNVARIVRLVEQAAAERHRVPHRLEGVGMQLLWHQADEVPRRAIIGENIMAAHMDFAAGRIDDTADGRDQRRLAGAVRAQQGEYLALANRQADVFQRLKSRCVGFR
jgi:hypothetical protein